MCDMEIRERRAFENMCLAIDKSEIYERVSIRNHKSFLPHGAIFKVTKDILKVGDIWALDLSPLELNNASVKGIAEKTGARRTEFSSKTEQQRKGPNNAYGPGKPHQQKRVFNNDCQIDAADFDWSPAVATRGWRADDARLSTQRTFVRCNGPWTD